MTTAIIKLVSTVSKDIDAIAKQIKSIATSINVKCKRACAASDKETIPDHKEDARAGTAATPTRDGRCGYTSAS